MVDVFIIKEKKVQDENVNEIDAASLKWREMLNKSLIAKKLNPQDAKSFADSNYCSCSFVSQQSFDLNSLEIRNPSTNEVFSSTTEHYPKLSEIGRSRSLGRFETASKYVSKSNKKPEKYKTEMCRNFEWKGFCNYGEKCQYAHGTDELMLIEKHPKYKTKLCAYYHTKGICDYGRRCNFIHDEKIKKIVK